eukprot:SAG31_NODE_95_length_25901_cov_24.763700_32_plen_145_part_00
MASQHSGTTLITLATGSHLSHLFPSAGLPSLTEDIDGVSDWMARLGDSIKLESFDKSRRVNDEAALKVIKHVEWWARNELPSEKVEKVEEHEKELVTVITVEGKFYPRDLRSLWSPCKGAACRNRLGRDMGKPIHGKSDRVGIP